MEIKHLEKRIRKYVIAVLSTPTMYLYKKPAQQEYHFFKDIEKATKTLDRKDAEDTITMYMRSTGDTELELVVIPIDVTFELIEEQFDEENYGNALVEAVDPEYTSFRDIVF